LRGAILLNQSSWSQILVQRTIAASHRLDKQAGMTIG
jgi:hypothetical protein